MLSIIITIVLGIGILAYATYAFFQADKIKTCADSLNKILASNNLIYSLLSNESLKDITHSYQKTILYIIDNKKKSNYPAQEYFNESEIYHAHKINIHQIEATSSLLVGLGVFGTFLGLTLGVGVLTFSDSQKIQEGIDSLLGGMGMAFITSVLGMGCSIGYTLREKADRENLSHALAKLTTKLDDEYYIDDMSLNEYFQKTNLDKLISFVGKEQEAMRETIMAQTTYTNKAGVKTNLPSMIQKINEKNDEHTLALESISANLGAMSKDIASELNSKFKEVLSDQLQKQIIPALNDINGTTAKVITQLDAMAEMITAPATEMIHKMVEELHVTVEHMVNEFKEGIISSAKAEITALIESANASTAILDKFPAELDKVHAALETNMGTIKDTITEIVTSSTNANNEMIEAFRVQFADNISTIKSTVEVIDTTLKDNTQEISSIMTSTASSMTAIVEEMIESSISATKNITDNIENATDMLCDKTNEFTTSMDTAVTKFIESNKVVTDTITETRKICDDLNGTSRCIENVMTHIKFVTETFEQSQREFSNKMEKMDAYLESCMDNLFEQIQDVTKEVKDQHEKYESIRTGLGDLFNQLQGGLNDYSAAVRSSIQSYLDIYTKSLTETTGALAATIQQQNEMVEILIDTVNSNKNAQKKNS